MKRPIDSDFTMFFMTCGFRREGEGVEGVEGVERGGGGGLREVRGSTCLAAMTALASRAPPMLAMLSFTARAAT
jgi:hypothetical protein